MDFIPVLACLVTGQRLGEARQNAFQLEMQAEQMHRQVADLVDDSQLAQREKRAFTRLCTDKRELLADLFDELKALKAEDGKVITVATGLRQRKSELTEAA